MTISINQKGFPGFTEPQLEGLELILNDLKDSGDLGGGAGTAADLADMLEDAATAAPADLARIQSSVSGDYPLTQPYYLSMCAGDSLTQGDAGFASLSSFSVASNTLWAWMCRLSAGRLISLRDAGIATQTSAQILARMPTDVMPRTKLGFVMAGTNDLGVVATAATVENVRQICLIYAGVGARPVVIGVPPKNAAVSAPMGLNRALRKMCMEYGYKFLNPWQQFCLGDGTWKPGLSDGTHPNEATCVIAAQTALAQLFNGQSVVEVPTILPCENADPVGRIYISAAANSCFMTDTDGNGAPNGWNQPAAGSGLVLSLESAVAPAVGKTLVATATGVTATVGALRATAASAVKAGQWHIFVGRVAPSGCVAGGLRYKISCTGSGFGVQTSWMTSDNSFVFCIPFKFQGGADVAASVGLSVQPVSGTGSGVVRLSQVELYLASDIGINLD